jgi:RND family efflux transporter MFP subunit
MDTRKLSVAVFFLVTSFTFAGCEEPPKPVVASSRPVKTMVIGDNNAADARSFPAVVDAIKKADISFRVSGKINKINVRDGDQVKEGQLLAELDPIDFEIRLKDRKASYDTAKANYERAKELVKKGAISQVDHDQLRAKYHTAKANLEVAEQDLLYTKLRANFDGYIAKRYVENFEEVTASEKIFSLEDVSALKVIIDVPENLMILIEKSPKGKRKLTAQFNNISDKKFPLSFVEATTKADPKTKTFRITLKMDAPEDYNILPGMTATVTADLLPGEKGAGTTTLVPASAVVSDNNKRATVWLVDEDTMTVKPKSVTPGQLLGDSMEVSGLASGDRVVVAGASFLREGMKVTLLKTGEQPE